MKAEEKNELIKYGIRAIATTIAIIILFIYFFVGGLEVHAEEITRTHIGTEYYHYENGSAYDYYSEKKIYVSGSNFKVIAFYYEENCPGQNYLCYLAYCPDPTNSCEFLFEKESKRWGIFEGEDYTGENSESVSYDKSTVTTETLNGNEYTYNYIIWGAIGNANGIAESGSYSHADTTLMTFSSKESALKYITNGSTDGMISGFIDLEGENYDENYNLKNFNGDNIVNASWSGTTERSYLLENDVYEFVRVRAGYSWDSQPAQIADVVTLDADTLVSDLGMSLDWDSLQHEDETLMLRYLQFYPIYASDKSLSTYYYGNPCTIYYNPDGSVEKITGSSTSLEDSGVFNSSLEIPRLSVDSIGYDFGFNNGTSDLYFEMKGRWYSVDDIELYKENLMWKYKYSTLLKSNLTTWVDATDKLTADKSYNFTELGQSAFDDLLNEYPVSERNYYGGTNALGNFFSGYNDALDALQMLLNEPTSAYNGVEVYVRYFYYDSEGVIHYSKWSHWYDNLADASGSSGSMWDDKENLFTENQSESGLTNSELDELESNGNTRNDTDAQPTINNSTNYVDNSENILQAFQNFFNMISGLIGMMGSFPSMIAEVFGFLPNWVITLIGLGIGAVILLRFLGR